MAGLSRAGSFSAARLGLPLGAAGAPLQAGGGGRLGGALQVLLHLARSGPAGCRPACASVDGARALRLHVLFDRALLALPFLDQRGEPELVVLRCWSRSAASRSRSVAIALRRRDQFAEVAGQFLRARAHFGHHGAEQHRGAQRLQRVFRPHQQRRRRAAAGALQRRQHLDDFGAARIQRGANLLLAGCPAAAAALRPRRSWFRRCAPGRRCRSVAD